MPRINSVQDAAVIFPSFENPEFLFKTFVLLERYTLKCIELEFYIAVFGILLTICHLTVLTRKTMMTSSIISIMIGVGICDMISMIVAISVEKFILNFYRDECTPPLDLFSYRLFWILMHCRENVIRCSTWLGFLMAFVRFLSLRFVSRPSFKRISNLSFGFYAIAISFILSSIMSTLNSMRTKIIETGSWTPNENCPIRSNATWILHELRPSDLFSAHNGLLSRAVVLMNGTLSRILPCIFLPLLTILLTLEIRRARIKISTTTSSFSVRKSMERTTTLVIFMAATFFIASLPAGLCTLFQVIYTDVGFLFLCNFVDHFCNAILTINASIHCII